MGSLGVLFDRKARYIAAAVAILLAMILPALVSAAQITSRSVVLSTASANADDATYQVNFTAVGAAGAFVVDFCQESPLVGSTCTAPAGFDATNASSTTTNFTDVSDLDANTLVVTRSSSWAASAPISVELDNIDNPTNAGTIYARILTYASDTNADEYTSTDLDGVDNLGGPIDDGGVAISITDTASVSGAVLETLQFCALSVAPTAACANASVDANKPVLRLGDDVGGVVALDDSISEGTIFTQISTNAASGAVVSLKSANPCGGLMRVGASGCDIEAALTGSPVATGSGSFGMRIVNGTDPDAGANSSGTYQINGSFYNGSDLLFNYVSGDASGVTSTYGDQILNTSGNPARNKNMNLVFGASSNASVPAGNYANSITLIATGTF